MTVAEFLRAEYALTHDVSGHTLRDAYSSPVVSFGRFLHRPAVLADLTDRTVNLWLAWLVEQVSRETAHSYRRILLVLWREAYRLELVEHGPRNVRPIRRPERLIEGFSAEEASLLILACDRLQGRMPKINHCRRLFWRTFISTAWFTGLRLGDVLAIERQKIEASGRVSVVQRKTGRLLVRQIPLPVLAEVDEMRGAGPGLIWPLWQSTERELFREFQQVVLLAGLRGTIKWLRRGSASEVEKIKRGAGSTHLGHRTAGIFEKHYAVPRIICPDVPLPPPLS
jgi:integrase